jgi:hypothetical protein
VQNTGADEPDRGTEVSVSINLVQKWRKGKNSINHCFESSDCRNKMAVTYTCMYTYSFLPSSGFKGLFVSNQTRILLKAHVKYLHRLTIGICTLIHQRLISKLCPSPRFFFTVNSLFSSPILCSCSLQFSPYVRH